MYKKVDKELNFVDREIEVIDFWKKNNVFSESITQNEKGAEFSFYDGPPTANGKPHIGHIITRVVKDVFPRYRTMKGCHVLRKAGWDTHGLPVELEVEKLLGMDGKQDIEKYGIIPFIDKCKQSVWKYTSEWRRMSDRVGYWVDMDNPYVTYDDNYIESVWWSLKEIFNKGLIYKGHKIVPYCPRCGTALSSHEVAQGYKDVKEKSIVAKFKVRGEDNTFFLAWTTTPWTLPSNVALCLNPKTEYATVLSGGCKYILAKELVAKHFEEYEIIGTKKGSAYEKTAYEPLFDYVASEYAGKAWYITCDDFVTLTDGTGIVHIAPAFGEDDAAVGRKYGLPFVQLVNESGRFTASAKDYAGQFCKDADKAIIKDLKISGKLFSEIPYEHSYPFCWRCDTPLLYYARSTWFIKMTAVKDRLVANNKTVNWLPPSIGEGRMGNFLENVLDWGLSRERYWGTPLPIWVCKDCGAVEAIGSKAELKDRGGLKEAVELHKPYVDAVTFKCKCGGTMHRTPEVIDCWYDSGSMPFAQYHYPFENKELFEKTFPADFISEAVDQTRGWFYTLLAISTLLFDKAPFKNCIVLGHVCDENGIKMSKHKGNVVDPWSVLDTEGSDAVRWYFCVASAPWLPSRFFAKAVQEAQRKFIGTLWNTYSFYTLYAEIDKFDPTKYKLSDCKLSLMDKWLLSGLNTLIAKVDGYMGEYKLTESARAIGDFTDSLSNWYVRRCRERYWGSKMTDDKIAAYMTLYTALTDLSKLSAPFVPFITENIYQNIVRSVDKKAPKSIHLCSYPKADRSLIDASLEKGMDYIQNVTILGRSARSGAGLKNRQPLNSLIIASADKPDISGELLEVVADELNVKEVRFIDNATEYVSYELKPQLKTLGPKYGKLLNLIREHLAANAAEIFSAVKTGSYQTKLGGQDIELKEEDLLVSVRNKEGFTAESGGGVTVILDTVLNEELIEEGILRETISKIQTMRKESDFEVTDHITVYVKGSARFEGIIAKYSGEIKSVCLADGIVYKAGKDAKEWELNGETASLSVEKK